MLTHGEEEPQVFESASGSDASGCLPTERDTILQRISRQLVELDREEKEYIESIKRKRLELKRLWNSTLLIHTLPAELLTQVFAKFPANTRGTRSKLFSHSTSREVVSVDALPITGWHGLMLVCHYWRNLLVSNPVFWRSIDTDRHMEWTKLSLDRSATTSLDVRAGDWPPSAISMLYPHVHRFQRLFVRLNTSPEAVLSLLLGGGMPLLEDLELHEFTSRQSKRPVDPNPYLTSHLFPRLQTLVLDRMISPQHSSLYAQLRTLLLSSCPHHLSFDGFLDALAGSVRLEELTLKRTLYGLSDGWTPRGPIPHRPPIHLPCLRSFSLEQYGVLQTSRFLAHLLMPASARLSVVAYFQRHGGFPDTAGTLSALLPPNRDSVLPVLSTFNNISMTIIEHPWRIDVTGSIAPQPRAHEKHRADAQFTLHLNGDPGYDLWMEQGLRDLVECFGGSPLAHLELRGKHGSATVAGWARVFRTFSLLGKLVVGLAQYPGLCKVFLGLHATSSGAREGSSVACLNLTHVSAEGLGTVATYEAMHECFQSRVGSGARLEVLDLTKLVDGEDLTPQRRFGFIEDLRKVVGRVRTREG